MTWCLRSSVWMHGKLSPSLGSHNITTYQLSSAETLFYSVERRNVTTFSKNGKVYSQPAKRKVSYSWILKMKRNTSPNPLMLEDHSSHLGFTNSLCTWFTYMTIGHAPISEYHQRLFPNSSLSCPCSNASVQTHEHIIMQCDLHDPSTRPGNIVINSFVHFLADNLTAFSFDNRWPPHVVQP